MKNKNTCIPQNILLEYVENKLPTTQVREVENHITDCDMCADAIEGLSAMPAFLLPTIHQDITQYIDAQSLPPSNYLTSTASTKFNLFSVLQKYRWNIGTAASLLLIAILGTWIYQQQNNTMKITSNGTNEKYKPITIWIPAKKNIAHTGITVDTLLVVHSNGHLASNSIVMDNIVQHSSAERINSQSKIVLPTPSPAPIITTINQQSIAKNSMEIPQPSRTKKESYAPQLEDNANTADKDFYVQENVTNNEQKGSYTTAKNRDLAMYTGGNAALCTWVQQNLACLYNTSTMEYTKVATIQLVFSIDENGQVTNLDIKGVNNCNLQANKIIKQMPKWLPKTANGVGIADTYTFPLKYCYAGY